MSDVSNSANSESARDVSNLTISNASAAGVQLPSFLYEHDTYTEDAPAYSALPYEEAQQAIAASQVNSTNEETPAAPPVASSAATATSMPLSTTFIHPPLGNVDGQPGQPAPPLDQMPIFSQLQAAQQASYTSGNASVYTFGRRLATCKFFRPTKGCALASLSLPLLSVTRQADSVQTVSSMVRFALLPLFHFDSTPDSLAQTLNPPSSAFKISWFMLPSSTALATLASSLSLAESSSRCISLDLCLRLPLLISAQYTLVWAQHRGFYAVSVTGPGAVHVIGDPACNNGSMCARWPIKLGAKR